MDLSHRERLKKKFHFFSLSPTKSIEGEKSYSKNDFRPFMIEDFSCTITTSASFIAF